METFDTHLLNQAKKSGDEYAWRLEDAEQIVGRLEAAGCVVLGIEFWEFRPEQSSDPTVIGWTQYEVRPTPTDWKKHVRESADLARQAISRGKTSEDDFRLNIPEHTVWCCFVWEAPR